MLLPRTSLGRVSRRVRRGLTLLEVVISVALIALLLGALMTFFFHAMRVRDVTAAQADRTQLARKVLDQLAAELRGCLGGTQLGFAGVQGQQRLAGDRRSLKFLTTALPPETAYRFYRESDTLPPGAHDLREVGYSLWVDPEQTTESGDPMVGGVLRTEKRTLNQFLVEEDDPIQQRTDLWSAELGYLEFRYYDGVEWDIKWDITEGNSLPQLVQITVGFEPLTADELEDKDIDASDVSYVETAHHRDRYSVIVRIPAADQFFGSRVSRVGKQLTEQLGVEGGP